MRPTLAGQAGSILSGPQDIPLLKALLLPFGFHPRTILHNVRAYFWDLFGFWTILAGMGIIWFFLKSKKTFNTKYLILFLSLSLYLLIFYGSWSFFDNLLRQPSIGTSYVRYFLPIYIFSLPLIAGLLVWLWQRGRILKLGAAVLVLVLFLTSAAEVFAPLEGLASVKKTIQTYQSWQVEVYSRVEPGAVIVTRYGDKYLFPGRKVITGWETPEQAKAIKNLIAKDIPVYLYDFKSEGEAAGLKLSEPLAGWESLELRRIK